MQMLGELVSVIPGVDSNWIAKWRLSVRLSLHWAKSKSHLTDNHHHLSTKYHLNGAASQKLTGKQATGAISAISQRVGQAGVSAPAASWRRELVRLAKPCRLDAPEQQVKP